MKERRTLTLFEAEGGITGLRESGASSSVAVAADREAQVMDE